MLGVNKVVNKRMKLNEEITQRWIDGNLGEKSSEQVLTLKPEQVEGF